MSHLEEIFGPVIHTYSRAQAMADGILIDVSDSEAARLFKYPCAITSNLHSALVRGAGSEAATYNARLWDVLHMAFLMAKIKARNSGDSDLFFRVKVGNRNLDLWANCGPGDDAEPVMTFGFPEDR